MSSPSTEAVIVLTARMGSERLPGKVMAEVGGRPLLGWIAERLSEAGKVVIATTLERDDDRLAAWAAGEGWPVYRGPTENVAYRIAGAAKALAPEAEFWMRGQGDCPFPEPSFIKRAVTVLAETGRSAFFWCLPPFLFPVYGAREFPYRKSLWEGLLSLAKEDEREHPDLFFHRHRLHIDSVYHEPPDPLYFRHYRLEVDWPEDLELVRALYRAYSRYPTLREVIEAMDADPSLAGINAGRTERTGPYTSYTAAERRQWLEDMAQQPIYHWDGSRHHGEKDGKPIFCNGGCCLLGYASHGKLHLKSGVTIWGGHARIPCPCGAGRTWKPRSQVGLDN